MRQAPEGYKRRGVQPLAVCAHDWRTLTTSSETTCPGFGQHRVNFHRTPGKGTAGGADPTWPNRAGYSIPCAVMLGAAGGELGGGNSLAARERTAAVRENGSLGCAVCVVFSSSVSLLLLFPLFAALLNCPYPDPPVSASFFPFSSAPQRGEGRPHGTFVAGCSQTITPPLDPSVVMSFLLCLLWFSSLSLPFWVHEGNVVVSLLM